MFNKYSIVAKISSKLVKLSLGISAFHIRQLYNFIKILFFSKHYQNKFCKLIKKLEFLFNNTFSSNSISVKIFITNIIDPLIVKYEYLFKSPENQY